MRIVRGDQGTLVQYIQLALQRAGYSIAVDGVLGDETCKALAAFTGKEETECVVDDSVWEMLVPYLRGYVTHEVQAGDSFYEIAARYHISMQALMLANPGIGPLYLMPGMALTVPLPFEVVPQNVAYSSMLVRYVVEGLAVRYSFLQTGSIGQSVLKNELWYVRIGNGERELFYNAAFHANEWITTPLVLRFVEEYAQAYALGKRIGGVDAKWLFDNYSLYVVPMVNPDGVDLVNGLPIDTAAYERAREIAAAYPAIPFPSGWKANIEGVDLNLQFPAGWGEAQRVKYAQGYTTPAPRDYVGQAPLVAPESAAVYNFTLEHRFLLILAYHTQGEVIFWKYQDYEPARSYEIAQYFGAVSGYAVEETPAASGNAGYKDWFIMTYDRPGYTIEAGLGENPLPLSQLPGMYEANLGIFVGGMIQTG
ncbi:MAG: LysM peptidoglycan-binding domain-containing protein [Lachnospiraceae bacterium]|nr:LysM peptidoglycan-binding domain-containing protein [Lachnospiraceae bacterium]